MFSSSSTVSFEREATTKQKKRKRSIILKRRVQIKTIVIESCLLFGRASSGPLVQPNITNSLLCMKEKFKEEIFLFFVRV